MCALFILFLFFYFFLFPFLLALECTENQAGNPIWSSFLSLLRVLLDPALPCPG